ncbi:MAG: ABC transporter permease [Chloroflexi bacterium]|nr:ABC transporter permease [Chloroflexota bacterium]
MKAPATLAPAAIEAPGVAAAPPQPVTVPRKRTWLGIANRYRLASLVVVLLIWEVVAHRVNPLFLTGPSAIAEAGVQLTQDGELGKAIVSSLQTLAIGYVIAAVAGVGLGLVMGWYRRVDWVLDPLINALYATPNVALIPLIILWFGLGVPSKIVIVLLAALFPIIINTYAGVRGINASLVEVAQAYGARGGQLFTKIALPASMPYIMTGLRLAVGRAIVGMVVAEMFTRLAGLGGMIATYSGSFATDKVFVAIIVLSAGGVGLTELLKLLEARISPWVETARIK